MVHDWILEGLPPSLHQKHLKLTENESNMGSIFPQPPPPTTNISNVTSSQTSQLSIAENQTQVENKGNGANTESHSNVYISNNMPSSAQFNKIQGTFLINGQYLNGSSKERKDGSKEKDNLKPAQNLVQLPTNTQQQQQHHNHYIPKEYKIANKRLSKRSINLNLKSEVVHDDESIINITINLPGARTLHVNKSLEVKYIDSFNKKLKGYPLN